MKGADSIIFYVQLTLTLFLCFIVALELFRLVLEKRINKAGELYKQEDLLILYEDGKKNYNFSSDLHLREKGFPSYNPITKVLTFNNKAMFLQTEYIIFLHELAHVIDFNRRKTENLAKAKLIAANFSILFCLIPGVWLFLNDYQAGIGTRVLILVYCLAFLIL